MLMVSVGYVKTISCFTYGTHTSDVEILPCGGCRSAELGHDPLPPRNGKFPISAPLHHARPDHLVPAAR